MIELATRRGRPSNATLSGALERSRRMNAELRMELAAAADDMTEAAVRLEGAAIDGRADVVLHWAGRLRVQAEGYRR